jgi:hypothetical protein
MKVTKKEQIINALIKSGTNGMTTYELMSECKLKTAQTVHSTSHELRKKRFPGFYRKGNRYFLIKENMVTITNNVEKNIPVENNLLKIVTELSSIHSNEDRNDILDLVKKSLFYQGSAMALINANKTIDKIRREL